MKRLASSALPNALLYAASCLRQRPRFPLHRRLGIYKVDRLGDFVLALGAIRLLVQHFGVEHCVLFGSRFSAELAALEYPGLETVVLSSGHNSLWRTRIELHRMRRHPAFRAGVGTLVSLRHHRTLHDDLLIGAVPAKTTWGVCNSPLTDEREQLTRSRLKFDHEIQAPMPVAGECLELARHRALLEALIPGRIEASGVIPVLDGGNQSRPFYLGITPFGSSRIRDVPAHLLVAACQAVSSQVSEVRLWAEPASRSRYEALAETLRPSVALPVKIVETIDIEALMAEIRGARIVLSAETVSAHLATAMDKPLVTLLGGGHYGWFAPWRRSQRQQWVSHSLDCFGCNWHCRHSEPYCLTNLDAAQLAQAMNSALKPAARKI